MPYTEIRYEEVPASLLHDADELHDAVRVWYGPTRGHRPSLLAMGASAPGLGGRALCRAAARTGQVAGDGRITTILLTHAILREGARVVTPGTSGTALRRGLRRGLDVALEALQRQGRRPVVPDDAPLAGAGAVVPGGGVSLLRCAPAVERAAAANAGDESVGMGLVAAALAAPLRQLAENAGADPDEVVEQVAGAAGGWGFDVARAAFVDLVARGITEPARVPRTALSHAVRAASTLLLFDALLG